jgi:hypothetical protein
MRIFYLEHSRVAYLADFDFYGWLAASPWVW